VGPPQLDVLLLLVLQLGVAVGAGQAGAEVAADQLGEDLVSNEDGEGAAEDHPAREGGQATYIATRIKLKINLLT
jgi:hypothetical protein